VWVFGCVCVCEYVHSDLYYYYYYFAIDNARARETAAAAAAHAKCFYPCENAAAVVIPFSDPMSSRTGHII